MKHKVTIQGQVTHQFEKTYFLDDRGLEELKKVSGSLSIFEDYITPHDYECAEEGDVEVFAVEEIDEDGKHTSIWEDA